MHAILVLRASCISRQQTVFLSDFCLVPRPHFSSRPKRFRSRGPCDRGGLGNAVQGLGKSDLRFLVQWSICDCCAVQSAVCLKPLLSCRAYFSLENKTKWQVICKICAEIIVHLMFVVSLNGVNGKNSSRSIVQNIFYFLGVYLFYSRFQD